MSNPTGDTTGTPTTPSTAAPAAGAAGTPATQATGGAASPDWTTGLPDETRGYVQNKGWRNPNDVLDSYRGLEKLMGVPKDQLVQLPQKDDDAEGWGKVYQRLGRPEKAEDYKLSMPKEGSDQNFVKWAKDAFHGANLTTKQAEAVSAKWNEYVTGLGTQKSQEYQAKVQVEEASLKKEWGAAYDQNVKVAQRAFKSFGVDSDTITKLEGAMGFPNVMKFFQKIGAKMGEDTFVEGGGGSGFGVMTPDQARAQIAARRADPEYIRKYASGDSKTRAEFTQLHEWAYPEN